MHTKKIVCLYGGPGTGKTTTAHGVFYLLKLAGYNCESNLEYIKDWVWEGRKIKSGDQTYVFAKQARKERLYMESGCDFIITDSPLILTHFYGMKYDIFEQTQNTSLILLKHHHEICKHYNYKTEHIFLNRKKEYQQKGRNETEDVAKQIDCEIKNMLKSLNIKYKEINADENAAPIIVDGLLYNNKLTGVPI